MQQDSSDNFTIINFLARSAAIEAARQGEPGRCIAGQAAEMQRLAVDLQAPGDGVRRGAAGAPGRGEIERRLEDTLGHMRQLARLADSIAAVAHAQTRALGASGARAWHSERADELREQADVIAAWQRQLRDAIASDRERATSTLNACRHASPAAANARYFDPRR